MLFAFSESCEIEVGRKIDIYVRDVAADARRESFILCYVCYEKNFHSPSVKGSVQFFSLNLSEPFDVACLTLKSTHINLDIAYCFGNSLSKLGLLRQLFERCTVVRLDIFFHG